MPQSLKWGAKPTKQYHFLTHTAQAAPLCEGFIWGGRQGWNSGWQRAKRRLTQVHLLAASVHRRDNFELVGVAQTPQCEPCKSTGLHPSCLLYEDKTCIFTTLLFLWKGHRLVWNIKQRMPLEIKGTLEESGKLQKGFDGIYRSISSRYDGMKE